MLQLLIWMAMGEYEIVIKRQTKSIDNSFGGGMNVEDPETAWANGSAFLEAYDLTTGAFMWRVVLGPNIRQGTHYIPLLCMIWMVMVELN